MRTVERAIEFVRGRLEHSPRIALVLGSGLNALADSVSDALVIPGKDIPGYPSASVEGHHGDLVFGRLSEVDVLFVRGRFHKYEGHAIETLCMPVRIAAGLGCRGLIVTNAAGSLHTSMQAGSLMRITDHVAATSPSGSPLPGQDGGGRPDRMLRTRISCYDPEWGRSLDELALGSGIKLHRGVYVWTRGPSYETPAEIRYFKRMGGDAVGMSTVPEVTEASRLGLRVVGISAITNLASGLESAPLSHEDVLEVGKSLQDKLITLVTSFLRDVAAAGAEVTARNL
jgi:purine-nucleoside phosphorylase